jgi:hypothetical protein
MRIVTQSKSYLIGLAVQCGIRAQESEIEVKQIHNTYVITSPVRRQLKRGGKRGVGNLINRFTVADFLACHIPK